jgi:hypothetical protein
MYDVCMQSDHYFWLILIKIGMCQQILLKLPNVSVMKICSVLLEILHADSHSKANWSIFATSLGPCLKSSEAIKLSNINVKPPITIRNSVLIDTFFHALS